MTGLGFSLTLNIRISRAPSGGGGGATPADHVVTNDAEFSTALTAATTGQIIELSDTGTFTTLDIIAKDGGASTITIRGETTGVPVVNHINLRASPNIVVQGLKVRPNSTVPTSRTDLVLLSGDCDGVIIENCDIKHGYPFNGGWTAADGWPAFDPTADHTTYPDYGSYATGWMHGFTFAGQPTSGDTLQITTGRDGAAVTTTITWGTDVAIGATTTDTRDNLVVYINANKVAIGTDGAESYLNGATPCATVWGITADPVISGTYPTESQFNRIVELVGRGIAQGIGGSPTGEWTIRNNTISDVSEAIKLAWGGGVGKKCIINRNDLINVYQDFISVGLTETAADNGGFEVCGNLFQDAFSQPQDCQNPHSDLVQLFGDDFGTYYDYTIKASLVAGNVGFQKPGSRGQAQRLFISDYARPLETPVFADNLLLSRISAKGITLIAADTVNTGAIDGYLYRNTLLTNPKHNVPIGNELLANDVQGISAASASASTIQVGTDSRYGDAPTFVGRNITESITSSSNIDEAITNISTGLGNTSAAYATWFDTDTDAEWDAVTTPEAAITAFTPKVAYADDGAVRSGDTLDTLRDRWAVEANRPWSSMPSYVGWNDLTEQEFSTVVESTFNYVHAGQTARTFYGSGGEYRTADDRNGLVNVSAWATLPTSGSPGTIAHGKYLQLRTTTGSTNLEQVTVSVTIGSETFDWTATAKSTAVYPQVEYTATEPDKFTGSNTLAAADGKLLTLALLNVNFGSTLPASNFQVFYTTAGIGAVSVLVMTTGVIRVFAMNAAGTTIATCNITAGSLFDGSDHNILFSLDTSKASAPHQVWIDGVDRTGTVTYTQDALIGYTRNNGSPYYIGLNSTTALPGGFKLGATYVNVDAAVDLSVSENRTTFDASQIGTNGTGPTGAQPVIFHVGDAAQINDAAGNNFGSGTNLVASGTAAVTDVGTNTPWS